MKKREFNKLCRLLFIKKQSIPKEIKHKMLLFVVKKRGPIHPALVTDLIDWDWLECMGYWYKTNGFVHTCEHVIKT